MKDELTTYQGDKVKVGELVLFGMFGDRGMLVGGTEQDAMVAPIKTKGGVLIGFKEPVSVKNSFRKYHGDWKPTTGEQTVITTRRAEVVKPNRKPLKDMPKAELKQQLEEINKQPYVSLEGDIKFDVSALPKARRMLSKYPDLESFLKDASLADKMVVAKYLNTGKWEDPPLNLNSLDDASRKGGLNEYLAGSLLTDYVGIDTRGIWIFVPGIGKTLDPIGIEKKIDRTLGKIYVAGSGYEGSRMKSGRVWQKMQSFWRGAVNERDISTKKESWPDFVDNIMAGKYTESEAVKELRERGGARTEKDAQRYYKALTSKYRDTPPEMLTQAQYVESQFSPATVYNRGGYPEDVAKDDHEAFVEAAIADGKPVPAKVLVDYPNLKGKHKTAKFKQEESSEISLQFLQDAHDLMLNGKKLGTMYPHGTMGRWRFEPTDAVLAQGVGGMSDLVSDEQAIMLYHDHLELAKKHPELATAGRKAASASVKTTDLQSIHDSRSPRSKESDERQSNADTIEPDDPRVEQWLRDPGSMDIVGIDTPKKGKSGKGRSTGKKASRKTRKSTRTETQVRGIRK